MIKRIFAVFCACAMVVLLLPVMAAIPMFQPDGYTATFGELSPIEKHGIDWSGGHAEALSHRARAFLLLTAACLRKTGP